MNAVEQLTRFYVCACGTVGVLGLDDKMKCRLCNSDEIEWFNLEISKLKNDLKFINNVLVMSSKN
jgi:hypothetical protein